MDNRVRSHSIFFRTFKCVKGAILTWTWGNASLSCWRQLGFGSSVVDSGRTFDGLAPILALAHVMAQRRSSSRIAARRRQRSLGAKLALLCVVLLRVAFSTPRSRKDVDALRRWRQRAALRRALQAPPQLGGFHESLRQLCISGVARAAPLRQSIAIYVRTVVFLTCAKAKSKQS